MERAITYNFENIFLDMIYILHFINDVKAFQERYPDKLFIHEAQKNERLMTKVNKVLNDGIQKFLDYVVELKEKQPKAAEQMWRQLGLKSIGEDAGTTSVQPGFPAGETAPGIFQWRWFPSYTVRVSKGDQLFPRIEKAEGKGREVLQKEEKGNMQEPGVASLIGIDDFAKVELRVGRVKTAERVEKSDKLIRLLVDIGEERQIVAGIGKSYDPADLIGREIVVIANLKPARLMGVESHGMLLAATDADGTCSILTLDRAVKEGSWVK